MESLTKQRLSQFIAFQRISNRKFSEKISASPTYFTTTKSIGSDKLEMIHQVYPQLNMDWVITGRGAMLVEEDIPIPNFIKQNFSYLLSTLQYNNVQTFSSITGIDFSKTMKIFHGNEWPTMEEVRKVALHFNCPVDEILFTDMREKYQDTGFDNSKHHESLASYWEQKYLDLCEHLKIIKEVENNSKRKAN